MKFDSLQKKLTYTFKNQKLLTQALTHKSYSQTNYERLEFVGDGILDYVIALNLYRRYPQLQEGELSKIRAALVNQDTLCKIAQTLNLGEFLLIGDGEQKSGGRERPSILADSLEAVIAAISLDTDIIAAQDVIENLYASRLNNLEELSFQDSKSLLQEYLQERRIAVPDYVIARLSGPEHESTFYIDCVIPALNIRVQAQGRSKKEASQLAAAKTLKLLKENNV